MSRILVVDDEGSIRKLTWLLPKPLNPSGAGSRKSSHFEPVAEIEPRPG
jgi:hypothetical protein